MEGADTFAGRVGGDAVEIANVVMSSVAECERKDIPVTADALALWLTCKPGTPGTVILTTSGQLRQHKPSLIQLKITEMIRDCTLHWHSGGLHCAPKPDGKATARDLELPPPAPPRSTSRERVFSSSLYAPEDAPPVTPRPGTTSPSFSAAGADSGPHPVQRSRGELLARIGGSSLKIGTREPPKPIPRILSSVVGKGPGSESSPSSTGASDTPSTTANSPHSSVGTASSNGRGTVSIRIPASGSKQSYLGLGVPVVLPQSMTRPGLPFARKHMREDVDRLLSSVPALAGLVPPPINAPTEWITRRSGSAGRDLERDGEADAKRLRPEDTAPVDLFADLSPEQQLVMELVLSGKNVFFTGSAGTGKSFLLKRLVKALRSRAAVPDSVYVTASTGIAACAIDGVTVHSFGGLGLAKESAAELVERIRKSRAASSRWRTATVLIIDEISMIDGDLFDKLEEIGKKLRCSIYDPKPFGGLQLVLSGDFYQLPPVRQGSDFKFCFQSKCWSTVVHTSVALRQVFRQKDLTFSSVLNEFRVGHVRPEAIKLLEPCFRRPSTPAPSLNGVEYTVLFAKNCDVDAINNEKLSKLGGKCFTFEAVDNGDEVHLKNMNVPEKLQLKLGAQVVLLKNLSSGDSLVNGSRGVVIDFRETEIDPDDPPIVCPIVRFASGAERTISPEVFSVELGGKVLASRSQVPLRCAWALSMHKSQGMSIDRLRVCLEGVFECGQAYVALSRATSLEGLIIEGFNPALIRAHPAVADFYRKLEKSSSSPPVPSALSPVPTKKPPSFTAMPRKLAPPTQLHQAALSLAGGGVRADGQHTFGGVKAEAQEQRAYGGIGGVSFTGGALKTEAHARSHTSVSVAKAEAAAATKASLFQDLLAGLTSDDF